MNTIAICNLALQMLGIPEITSFDETNNNARLCKSFYPVCRDRVLRDHLWSFATTYTAANRINTTSNDPEYEFVCQLPNDCIRIIGLTDNSAFRRIGGVIYTNNPNPMVSYIRRVDDPEEFDVNFVEALQYLLATEIGMANTRDANLISMYRQEYERRLSIARAIDSQENRSAYRRQPLRSSWLNSRRSGNIEPRPSVWTEGTAGRQQTDE